MADRSCLHMGLARHLRDDDWRKRRHSHIERDRRPARRRARCAANRFFDRWGLWAVFLGRLLPIVRTYISFPAGLSRIGYVRFTIVTLFGAIPWNAGLAYAGFLLGQHYEEVATTLAPFAIPIAIAVVIVLAAAWWFGRRLAEEEEAKPEKAVTGRV